MKTPTAFFLGCFLVYLGILGLGNWGGVIGLLMSLILVVIEGILELKQRRAK